MEVGHNDADNNAVVYNSNCTQRGQCKILLQEDICQGYLHVKPVQV